MSPASLAVCSWSLQPRSCDELLERLRDAGLSRIQLALNPLIDNSPGWESAADQLDAAGVKVVTGMMGMAGEDYSTLASIRATGGIVPDEHWETNLRTAQGAAELAEAMGLPAVSFHAGFIPHDPADPAADKLARRVTRLADVFADHGLTLLLETGQETHAALGAFLDRADRSNLRVNFDPANMILYGMGDPIEALRALMPRVGQVHLKDALPTDAPGEWGTEVPVGRGAVDWPGFFGVLNEHGYEGDLVIEREAGDDRVGDVRTAVDHVASLLA